MPASAISVRAERDWHARRGGAARATVGPKSFSGAGSACPSSKDVEFNFLGSRERQRVVGSRVSGARGSGKVGRRGAWARPALFDLVTVRGKNEFRTNTSW